MLPLRPPSFSCPIPFSGLLLLCFYWCPPNAWAPPPSLFRDMSRFGTHRAPPVPPSSYRPIPSPVRQRHSFFVDCCIFYNVLQPIKTVLYFNFIFIFCHLIFRCHTVAKHTPTRSATVARPLRFTPSPRASSSGLLLLFFIGGLPMPGPRPPLYFRNVSRFSTQSSPPSAN